MALGATDLLGLAVGGGALLAAGVFAAFRHSSLNSKAVKADTDKRIADANTKLDDQVSLFLEHSETQPSTIRAGLGIVAERCLKQHGKLFNAGERKDQLLELVWQGAQQPLADIERATRFLDVRDAINEFAKERTRQKTADQGLERVTIAFNALSSEEQRALAAEVREALYNEDETLKVKPAGSKYTAASASTFYDRLEVLAGSAGMSAAIEALGEPSTPPSTTRFVEQMRAFEQQLAASVGSDVPLLQTAHKWADTQINKAAPDLVKPDAENWLKTIATSITQERSNNIIGCKRTNVEAAVARAQAPWATPLERAGFAYIATQFSALLKAGQVASRGAGELLAPITAHVADPAEAARASTIWRTIQALQLIGPNVKPDELKLCWALLATLDASDRVAVAALFRDKLLSERVYFEGSTEAVLELRRFSEVKP